MPVQLHVYTARPLNDHVPSDGIVERTDQDIGTCRTRGSRRAVEIGHEISRAFGAEGVQDRSLESNTDSVPTGVKTSCDMVLLGVGVTVKTPCFVLFRRSRNQARDRSVEFFGRDVDVELYRTADSPRRPD
jgi:hypothetical protein